MLPHERLGGPPPSFTKRPETKGLVNAECGSAGANDLAGLQALRADVQPARRAVHQDPNPLDVRIPPAVGPAVRVRHLHAEEWSLPAYFAHCSHGQGMVAVAVGTAHGHAYARAFADQEVGGTLLPRRRLRRTRAPSPRRNAAATRVTAKMPTRLEPVGARPTGPVAGGVVETTEGEGLGVGIVPPVTRTMREPLRTMSVPFVNSTCSR